METDLTNVISQYLDRHLVLPLLEFIESHPNMEGLVPSKQILEAKLELLQGTSMVDFAADMFISLNEHDPPQDFVDRRERVLLILQTVQEDCSPLLNVVEDKDRLTEMIEAKNFNMTYLSENCDVTAQVVESLYEYAKFQFDVGNYADAADYLHYYRVLAGNSNPERLFFSLWGKLAADILVQNWDAALAGINTLKEAIDSSSSQKAQFSLNPLQQLQQRTWLIHWSLFVYFNHKDGLTSITELFFQDRYLNAIQTNCPHILRYLATAVIISKNKPYSSTKDLVRLIQQESYTYRDAITEFVECLYVSFDFEGAQNMLQKCEDTLKRDFFLVDSLSEFLESARLIIFEIYCRIHQCIDIKMLADKLNMNQEDAEMWVVNLVRNAKLDAKIDSRAHQVLMGVVAPSIYEQIVDNTKGLMIRTSVLSHSIERGAGLLGAPGTTGAGGEQRGEKSNKQWRGQNRRGGDRDRGADRVRFDSIFGKA